MCIIFLDNIICLFFVFFFKQKTAYEMRISDWSSDVCSSDLRLRYGDKTDLPVNEYSKMMKNILSKISDENYKQWITEKLTYANEQIGRASCRERVCQYV